MLIKLKKFLFVTLGVIFLGFAYIGAITPGIPTTFFVILALWSFSKSSPKLSKWVKEHKPFGKYVTDWQDKRIYPTKGRWAMVVTMSISATIMYFTVPVKVLIYALITFALVITWAFRYPGSEEEYDNRVKNNKKIGWLK